MVASAALAALHEAKLGSEPMHERGSEPLSRPPFGANAGMCVCACLACFGGVVVCVGGGMPCFVCVHSCAPSVHVHILCGGVGAFVRRNTRKNNC